MIKKSFKILRSVAVSLLAVVICVVSMPFAAAESSDKIGKYIFTIENPYEEIDWDKYKPYRMATHVHTVRSDGDVEIDDMIEKYYELGYQGVSLTDHGTVNYGWTSDKARLAIFGYQAFVHGALDPLTEARYKEITTGVGRNGDKMIDIPLGIELNGSSSNKCHINSYFADCGHGDLEISTTWPRTAVEKSHKAGGITHINHVGEWAEAKDDIGVYDEAFVSDFASIYMDYDSCVGMELVNTTDNRTRNDRYLYDEVLKVLAPQGRNIFGFCEDDSHEFSDCANNAQFFMMPENTAQNVRHSMETGTFFACSKNAKTPDELGDGFAATGDFPMVSRIDVDDDKDTITISPYNATVIKMVADGVVIDTKTVNSDNEKITFDLNEYEDKIGSYVRFYAMGPGGICYIQPFLLTKQLITITRVQFNIPSINTKITVFDKNGTEISPLADGKTYSLDIGSYVCKASLDGYIDAEIPFEVTLKDFEKEAIKLVGVNLKKLVIKPSADTTIVDNTNNYIYGIRPGSESLDEFVDIVNGASVKYETTRYGFGTGTKVVAKCDGQEDTSYTVIIFGDVNGDGLYDGQDAFMVSLMTSGVLQADENSWFAADCNHDGVVNEYDVNILTQAGIFLSEVKQNSLEEVTLSEEYLELIDQSPVIDNTDNSDTADDTDQNEEQSKFMQIIEKIADFVKKAVDTVIEFIKDIFSA